jgi:hypothetical protein
MRKNLKKITTKNQNHQKRLKNKIQEKQSISTEHEKTIFNIKKRFLEKSYP